MKERVLVVLTPENIDDLNYRKMLLQSKTLKNGEIFIRFIMPYIPPACYQLVSLVNQWQLEQMVAREKMLLLADELGISHDRCALSQGRLDNTVKSLIHELKIQDTIGLSTHIKNRKYCTHLNSFYHYLHELWLKHCKAAY